MSKATIAIMTVALLGSGCASMEHRSSGSDASARPAGVDTSADTPKVSASGDETTSQAVDSARDDGRRVELYPGDDRFLRQGVLRESAVDEDTAPVTEDGSGVELNFEEAPLGEVVNTILGEVLGYNYSLEPGLQGAVTLRTSQPIPRENLIPVLESLLQARGAVLVKTPEGLYRVGPRAALKQLGARPGTGKVLPPGYSVQIVTLDYISAGEMQKILQPLAPEDAFLRVDPTRNLLMLGGTRNQLTNLLDTIEAFDVDALEGTSVAIYEVKNREAGTVSEELDKIFGKDSESPLSGMVRVIPLENLSSVMVLTPRKHLLKKMETWVKRLDRAGETAAGTNLYVYPVQNGRAEHLAGMLNELLSGDERTRPAPASRPDLAPGLKPATLTSASREDSAGDEAQGESPSEDGAAKAAPGSEGEQGIALEKAGDVRIVADEKNNTLLIMANQRDYQRIQQALKKIDAEPLQVLVEASIMEVTLTGSLRYGLQWFFKNTADGKVGEGILDLDDSPDLSRSLPGFSYTLTDSAGVVRAVLNTLATDDKLRVISSPSLMVLDNHTAEIRVGNQQPVSAGSSATEGGVVTENFQYKDTGVLLEVTPRVNSGGLVTMEVNQEVTDVGSSEGNVGGNPTFFQRVINSTVAVQSGDTVVLGGLIRDNSSRNKSGLPGLYQLPVVGNLFGQTSRRTDRTELLVLLTPRAVEDRGDAEAAGEELRKKMKGLMESFSMEEPTATSEPARLLPMFRQDSTASQGS